MNQNKKRNKWLEKNIPNLKGKNFLITGSSSGIGLEAAKDILLKQGKVYFAVRNKNKIEKVISELKKEIGTFEYEILIYDQSSEKSIEAFFKNLPDIPMESIILNAGIYFPQKGSVAEDGTGLTFYTNCIGTFKLLDELKNKYQKSRFILVNSLANFPPHKKDYNSAIKNVNYKRGYEYALSKRSIMNLFGYYMSHNKDIFITMTHPGISATNIIGGGYAPVLKKLGQAFLYVFVHKPWKACLGEVYLACSDKVSRGDYIVPRGPFHISGYPKKTKIPNRRTYRDSENLIKVLKENY